MGGYNPQNDWIGQLYHENFKPLYRYAKNALNDPSIAEEATQEVFCLACVKSEELSQSNNPQGWLMNTLKNLIRSTKREQAKLKRLVIMSLDEEESDLLATYDEEDIDILLGDVSPLEDFQILKMIVLNGYSMKEAADEYGISLEACKKRVQRIKKRLQKNYHKNEKNCPFYRHI